MIRRVFTTLIFNMIGFATAASAMFGSVADNTYTSPRERFKVEVPFKADVAIKDGDRAPGLGHDSVTFSSKSAKGVGHRVEYVGAPFKTDSEFYVQMERNASAHQTGEASTSIVSREKLEVGGRAAYRVTMEGTHPSGELTVLATYIRTDEGMVAASSWFTPTSGATAADHDHLVQTLA